MNMSEQRDALARIIDPESWDLYDDERMQGRNIRETLVQNSREVADKIVESGLMVTEKWDRKEYFRARDRILERTSRKGKCYSVEDGLDGYFMHDPRCTYWPSGAVGGFGCVK
jgi:hypothetical protein